MPANPLHLLRINARELLRQPGTERSISTELVPTDLGVDDDRTNGEIGVELVATSNIDGVLVSGTLVVPWRAACRRCLTDVDGRATVDVQELYQDEVREDDAFPIEGDQIDLGPAVREYVLLELPRDPLCRDTCAGICPQCGIDRNTDSCACVTTVRDERWAALDDLRLDD